MNYPKCNNEMIQGFIQSARGILWSTKKHKVLFVANEGKGEIWVTNDMTGDHKEAFSCPKCGTIVIPSQD